MFIHAASFCMNRCSVAFSPSKPLGTRSNQIRLKHLEGILCVRRNSPPVIVGAAHPPRRVGSVAKDVREALQKSLQARNSRIVVKLPYGAKLGTEKRSDDESVSAQRVAGDRELARILSGMFEGTGLSVCVAFATEGERNAAKRLWGKTCKTVVWDSKSAKNKKKGKGKKSIGFGTSATSPNGNSDYEDGSEANMDVIVAVGGGSFFMQRVRSFADSVGMDKLVIFANANSSMETIPFDVQRYFEEQFESVYSFTPNPSPSWSGGVLFRKYPDEWVLCRLTGVGVLRELIKSKTKPTMDEIDNVLRREGSTTGNQVIKSITDLFGTGN